MERAFLRLHNDLVSRSMARHLFTRRYNTVVSSEEVAPSEESQSTAGSNRPNRVACGCFALGVSLVAAAHSAGKLVACHTHDAPHILLIEADQMRADMHAASGRQPLNGVAAAPNLDSLAAEGAWFSHAYSSTSICTPARLALLTGRSTWRHGMRAYRSMVPPFNRNWSMAMPAVLAEHGYHTVAVGKNHYGLDRGANVAHGFAEFHLHEGLLEFDERSNPDSILDEYDVFFRAACPGCDPLATGRGPSGSKWRGEHGATPYNSRTPFIYPYAEELHPTHWTAEMAITVFNAWLDRWNRGITASPLFLKVSFHRPHAPYDPPERWLNKTIMHIGGFSLPVRSNWSHMYAGDMLSDDGLAKFCSDPIGAEMCGHCGSELL